MSLWCRTWARLRKRYVFKTLLMRRRELIERKTQTKMECWAIDNVRMAVEKGTLKSLVPEQVGLMF